MGMHLGIVTLFVNDQDRAKEFYTKKLGWEVQDDAPMGPDARWLSVAPPGAETALVLVKDFDNWTPEKVGGSSGIALEVDNVFTTAEALKKNGVEFETEPTVEFFGAYAVFKDSEGNNLLMRGPAPDPSTSSG